MITLLDFPCLLSSLLSGFMSTQGNIWEYIIASELGKTKCDAVEEVTELYSEST